MKKIVLLLICSGVVFAATLKLAVAANVGYAIKPLIRAYKKQHPETDITFTLGSSGKLFAQISHGASYDVFLCANMSYPQALYKNGKALERPKVYAMGSLVILSRKPRKMDTSLEFLLSKEIKKIAIANPKTAPYGKAALEVLQHKGYAQRLGRKFVFGESVGQTYIYAQKVCDVGFVAKSLLCTPKNKHLKEGREYITVDKNLYTPIKQGVVIVQKTPNKELAKDFVAFLFSLEAKEILRSYGYSVE